MKRLLRKNKMLLMCALLLFSLGCIRVMALADAPQGNGMDSGTGISASTPANATKITLEPGDEGSLDGKEGWMDEDGVILELPDPTRRGWKFEGWYTAPGKETYLDGGDTTGNEAPYERGNDSAVLSKLKEQLAKTSLASGLSGMSDDAILNMHHSWVIDRAGTKVKVGDTIEVDTLYAVYSPNPVTINWNSNGWEGSTGTLRSGRHFGAYAYTPDWSGTWGSRTFEGWSFTKGGSVDLPAGYVYKIGESPLDFTDSDTINLYAVWSGDKDVTGVKVETFSDGAHKNGHFSYDWKYFLVYKVEPSGAVTDSITWSTEPAGVGTFEKQSGNMVLLSVSTQTAKAKKLTSVTVKATAANGVVGTIELALDHNWQRNYTYEPNCQHTGYAVDKCTVCGMQNQPTLPKTEHTFSYTETLATCTEPGYKESVCTVCGEKVVTKTQEALGHNWSEYEEVEICGGVGHVHSCLTCGVVESDVDVNNSNHVWSETPVVDQEPTCSKAGSQSYHCLRCGLSKDSEVIPPDPTKHNWSNWSVTKKPEVGVVGTESRSCGNCRIVEKKDIPALLPSPETLAQQGIEENPNNVPPSESTDAPGSGSADIPVHGTTDAPDNGTTDVPDHGDANVPDSGSTETPGSDSTETPGSGNTGSSGSNQGGPGSGSNSGYGSGSGSGGGSGSGSANPVSDSTDNASAPAETIAVETPLPIVPTAEIREALPSYVEVGTWDKAADGTWTCKDNNGQLYTNRWAAVYNPYAEAAAADAYDWFRFDESGHLITGWYVDPADGSTYYMNPVSDGTQGRMMTGWVTIDGKEYYFHTIADGHRGRMYKNEATPDGHFVGADGAKIR